MDPVEFARILANIKQESNDVKPTKLTTGHSGADRTPHKCAPFAFFPISDDEDETAVIYRTKLPSMPNTRTGDQKRRKEKQKYIPEKKKVVDRDSAVLYDLVLDQLTRSIAKLKKLQPTLRHDCIRESRPNPFGSGSKTVDKFRVPQHMGWDWRRGQHRENWQPGAITKPVRQIMSHFNQPKPNDGETALVYRNPCSANDYTITMSPPPSAAPKLRAPNVCAPDHIHVTSDGGYPMQFRVDQHSHEQRTLTLIAHMKNTIRQQGYGRCVCRQPISHCVCRTPCDHCALLSFVGDCERHFELPGLAQRIYLDDLGDVTLEFTPPAAMPSQRTAMRKCSRSVDTQYLMADIGKEDAKEVEVPKRVSKVGDVAEKKDEEKKPAMKGKKGAKKGKKGAKGAKGKKGKAGAKKGAKGKKPAAKGKAKKK